MMESMLRVDQTGAPSVSALPRSVSERLGAVHAGLRKLETGEGALDALKGDLSALCLEAREARPLEGDLERQVAVSQALSSANKISMYASLAALPAPTGAAVAMAGETPKVQIRRSVEVLERSLETVFTETGAVEALHGRSPRPDLVRFVDVPAGQFAFGYENRPVHLPDFRISKYPVTNAQFQEFVDSTGYRPQGGWSTPDAARENHPAVNVTFYDAKAFCRWAGCRLPSEKEWEKAARGTDGRHFPWGNDFHPELCNNDGTGTSAVDAFERPRADGRANVSPYGAVDMAGNVLEWVDSGPERRPGSVLLKGGAWTNYASEGGQPFDCIRHTSETPESSYVGFGFRVALDGVSARDEERAAPDLGWQVSDPEAAQGRPLSPLGLAPEPVAKALGGVQEEVRRVLDGESGGSASLLAHLHSISQAVRAQRPLTSRAEDAARQEAVARVHSLANRVAMNAAFVSTGHAPAGMALATCASALEHSAAGLEGALARVYSGGSTGVAAVGGAASESLVEWKEIPAGRFQFGRNRDILDVPGFEISRTPVTNAQFHAFVKDTGYQAQGGWRPPAGGDYPAGEDSPGQHPVVNVTFHDAEAFAHWAGGRLPSEAEWEKAARGTDGRQYPWGNEWRAELVNHEGSGTSPVGRTPEAASPYGVEDMVGNVLEYVDTWAERRPGSVLLKGGAWSNGSLRPFDAVRHTSELPNGAYRGFGFRVARDLPR